MEEANPIDSNNNPPVKHIQIVDTGPEKAKFSFPKLNGTMIIYAVVAVAALLALASFVYFFILQPSIFAKTTNQEILPEINYIFNYTASLEDGIEISNGQAELSEIEDISKATGFALSQKIYDDLSKIDKGERYSITLSSDEAFGDYDSSKIVGVNRTQFIPRETNVSRKSIISITDFDSQFKKQPVINGTYSVEGIPWTYKVISIEGEEVVLSQDAKVGQIVPIDNIFYLTISKLTNEYITTMLTAEEQTMEVPTGNLTISLTPSQVVLKLTPQIGNKISVGENRSPGKVLRVDNDFIYMDYNSEFAGKKVVLEILRVK